MLAPERKKPPVFEAGGEKLPKQLREVWVNRSVLV
jgi:hypothetical protein